jgi:uncharacterized integral membrane protein (TIGR00698 family)
VIGVSATAITARPPAGRPGTRRPVPGDAPGLLALAALVAAAFALAGLVPGIAAGLWAMALGVAVAGPVRALPGGAAAAALGARPLLRAGVALLGLQVAAGELVALGPRGLVLAVGVVAVTLAVTVGAGRVLRVPASLALLVASGSAICGASAVAATASAIGADDEDAGYAVAVVTLFGTLAMVLVPVLATGPLGLTGEQAALWAGASIHEVAQVTGAGGVLGGAALATATLVKLARVALLAPTVALLARRAGRGADGAGGRGRSRAARPRLRARVLRPRRGAQRRAASRGGPRRGPDRRDGAARGRLAGLGLGIRPRAVRAAGLRPLALGLVACVAVLTSGLALVAVL